jgi:hypothetical protein
VNQLSIFAPVPKGVQGRYRVSAMARVTKRTTSIALALWLALCIGFLSLVALSPAWAVLVATFQGESMTEPRAVVAPFTGTNGVSMMRWDAGAGTGATASQSFSPDQQIDEIRVIARQPSGGTAVMAVVVAGSVAGTFSPSASGFAPSVVNLATPPASRSQHTVVLRPNTSLPNRVDVDYFEVHNTGSTNPVDTDGDGVTDDVDQCDTEPGPASNNGCPVREPASAVLMGAGDIADVGSADVATGNLIEAVPAATALTLGDGAYENGSLADYNDKYTPSWGSFVNRTWPSPGNHDYRTANASSYKSYFDNGPGNQRATPIGSQTYYAFDAGPWRWYSLDSNVSATTSSAQYQWLQNDLANNRQACIGAYWHHPVASSGEHGGVAKMRAIFQLLDSTAVDADLVLAGHDHNYERFAKINSTGGASASGIQQVIVGTGGTALRPFPGSALSMTVVRNANTHGVLRLDLSSTGAEGRFIPAQGFGSFTDQFSVSCS